MGQFGNIHSNRLVSKMGVLIARHLLQMIFSHNVPEMGVYPTGTIPRVCDRWYLRFCIHKSALDCPGNTERSNGCLNGQIQRFCCRNLSPHHENAILVAIFRSSKK
jgi:hypothetical protein